jgi:alkylresorcinol/alkylpyrone synthase
VCAELCSLAFQPDDLSEDNLGSSAIFGDGAAAVLLTGPDAPGRAAARAGAPALRIRDTYREFFPGTAHFMGFDVNEAGLKIVLSRDIVLFARAELPGFFARACERFRLPGPEALRTGAVHPGGRRILEALEDVSAIPREVTRTGWECLRDHGNMSSVSVLASLDRLLSRPEALTPGALGVLSAFGPGFGAELALIEVAAAA